MWFAVKSKQPFGFGTRRFTPALIGATAATASFKVWALAGQLFRGGGDVSCGEEVGSRGGGGKLSGRAKNRKAGQRPRPTFHAAIRGKIASMKFPKQVG
jgi:hypothetical protein